MIRKIETARIVALDGYVELELEECFDGVLNIKIIASKDKVRIGIPGVDGTFFKFLSQYKAALEQEK